MKLSTIKTKDEIPSVEELPEFLVSKLASLEVVEIKKNNLENIPNSRTKTFITAVQPSCSNCQANNHIITNSDKFINLDVHSRKKRVREESYALIA